MGATHYVNTRGDKEWSKKLAGELDLIVCTSSSNKLPLFEYIATLKVHGDFVYVGMPEEGLALTPQAMAGNGAKISSSHIASKEEILQMLKLAEEKNVRPIIEVIDMKDAAKGIQKIVDGTAHFRTILKQDLDK